MSGELNKKHLLEAAIRAPSGHNTQPWKFSTTDSGITIHPDFSRRLPVVDPDDHALYISLGCAAENMVITAADEGFRTKVTVNTDAEAPFIRLTFTEDREISGDPLVAFINERQSTRNEYEDTPVPLKDLEMLEDAIRYNGVDLLLITGREGIDRLKPFIIEGSNRQFRNRNFVDELVNWIRFSKSVARSRRDGIWSKSMGLPNVPHWLGKFIMNYFVSAKSEAKRWSNLVDATAGLALFEVSQHDAEH
ncbi:MAG: hypothetical protein R3281_17405, partial [Balneolaceae bacterium]|nr:hypothetical protein [Balneolaceae bacterium]